jgi:hypothetical protein
MVYEDTKVQPREAVSPLYFHWKAKVYAPATVTLNFWKFLSKTLKKQYYKTFKELVIRVYFLLERNLHSPL